MYKRLRPIGLIAFAVCVLGVGLAAQMEERPHPIFEGLEVGERYDIRWCNAVGARPGNGYCEISNNPGVCQVVELGSDYMVYENRGHTFAVPITQIKFVTLRPSSNRR